MGTYRIHCIKKSPRDDTHHGIVAYGVNEQRYSRDQMVSFIKSGEQFFTENGGVTAWVGLNGPPGREWLQTYADGLWNNNLLALPECIG
jgi:hypothetical protein